MHFKAHLCMVEFIAGGHGQGQHGWSKRMWRTSEENQIRSLEEHQLRIAKNQQQIPRLVHASCVRTDRYRAADEQASRNS